MNMELKYQMKTEGILSPMIALKLFIVIFLINYSLRKIHGYRGKDITLRLPDNITIFDIDWFALYCITYRENFGHVNIPKSLNVPPDLQALASDVNFKNYMK